MILAIMPHRRQWRKVLYELFTFIESATAHIPLPYSKKNVVIDLDGTFAINIVPSSSKLSTGMVLLCSLSAT